MPGQFSLGDEILPEHVVKLECISSNVVMIQRNWAILRRLTFIGSNGKTKHFVVHHVHHQFNTGKVSETCGTDPVDEKIRCYHAFLYDIVCAASARRFSDEQNHHTQCGI